MTLTEKRLKCIVQALENLGGKAPYQLLYEEIKKCKEFQIQNFSTEKNFQATVRKMIQDHSSDSDGYDNKNKDLFYSVDGIGSGVWGLRNYSASINEAGFDADLPGYLEGQKKWKTHQVIERNTQLIHEAKKHFIQENGRLYCEVCGFNFEEKYGALGKQYIEAHHKTPLAKLGQRKTSFDDLLMVCPNCHRMIHRSEEAMDGNWKSILKKHEQ